MRNADLKPPLIDLEVSDITTGGKQDIKNIFGQPERLSEGDYNYSLYWIRLRDHSDIMSEGYVGITLNLLDRFRHHKNNKRVTHFSNAVKKYGWDNLVIDILKTNITKEEALLLERFYRPIQNIGWNSQQGGNLGVEKEWYHIPKNKELHKNNTSIRTKQQIKLKDSTEKRSERAVENWRNNRDSYKDKKLGSLNGRAILNEEFVFCIKCNLLKQGIKDFIIAKMYNVEPHVINHIRRGKNWKHIVCDSPAHKWVDQCNPTV